jgi:hypothetical protein
LDFDQRLGALGTRRETGVLPPQLDELTVA